MFTGIVEALGIVEDIVNSGTNIYFTISCPFSHELKIDQSVAHDGCCLTVIDVIDNQYKVAAIQETLHKTKLNFWQKGTLVNLERCVKMNGRLDGHIVQGHVDTVGKVTQIKNLDGSFLVSIIYDDQQFVTVPQGSITVDGISLTVAKSALSQFSVAIIPYTWENTSMQNIKVGDTVNLEFDIIGKYVSRLMRTENV